MAAAVGIERMALHGLDDEAAAALLDARAPGLAPVLLSRPADVADVIRSAVNFAGGGEQS
jgi:hypothetical protein